MRAFGRRRYHCDLPEYLNPPPVDDPELLFVYGLLRRGMSAELDAIVPGMASFVGPASVRGRLYSVGGAYPALVVGVGADADDVVGELWRIDNRLAWPIIDDFEGIGPAYVHPHLYYRAKTEVRMASGEVSCYVYVYNRPVDDLARVDSGDWAQR